MSQDTRYWIGQAGLALVAADLQLRGYSAYRSVSPTADYNLCFIGKDKNSFYRAEVKTNSINTEGEVNLPSNWGEVEGDAIIVAQIGNNTYNINYSDSEGNPIDDLPYDKDFIEKVMNRIRTKREVTEQKNKLFERFREKTEHLSQ